MKRLIKIIAIVILVSGHLPHCHASDTTTKAWGESTPVSRIDIIIQDTGRDKITLEKTAREIIFLTEGEPFSIEKVNRSIEALRKSSLFKHIDIPDPVKEEKGLVLEFRLTPFPRIIDIKISGGFPIFESEILNAMEFRVGSVFIKKKMPEQVESVTRLIVQQGYPDPNVEITSRKTEDDMTVTILVKITLGDFYRVRHVEFIGNNSLSTLRLKPRTKTWYSSIMFGGASRFVKKDLDEDVRDLVKFYREKGYPRVKLTATVKKDEKTNIADIEFQIHEGPLYKITFEGRNFFWRYTLKKDLVFSTTGDLNGFGLRRSIRNIKKRYKSSGFETVAVKTDKTTLDNVLNLKFIITEGIQSVVGAVNVRGNKSIDTAEIKEQMLTRPKKMLHDGGFDPLVLENDIQAIKALYLRHGFMTPQIIEKANWNEPVKDEEGNIEKTVDLNLNIEEGPCTKISHIIIRGITAEEKSKLENLTKLKQTDPFVEAFTEKDRIVILSMISEKGYPGVEVEKTVTFNRADDTAKVVYLVKKGIFTKLGDVFYSGNFRTKRSILQKEIETGRLDPFSLSAIMESRRNIRSMNAIKDVTFELTGLKEKKPAIDLLVNIEERKPYYFHAGAGYNTEKLLYMNMGGGDRNLFGLNKELSALVEISQIGHKASLTLAEQRLFGSRIDSAFNAFTNSEEKLNVDFGTKSYGASMALKRKLLNHMSGTLNLTFENREQFHRGDNPIPPEDLENYEKRSILELAPTLVYNSTDSFSRPRSGLLSNLSAAISNGLNSDIDDFFKCSIDARYYITPIKSLTLAVRGRYEHAEPYGKSDKIPDDRLVFLGGSSTVRGYEENKLRIDSNGDSVGGRTAILGNLEARYDLGGNFELITFLDAGAIMDTQTTGGSDDLRFSVGTGIAYITPIGPIEFMYGWKLDKQEGESSGCFNFSIGYTF